MLRRLLQWSFDSDILIFDFTDGDEPYKAYWCDDVLELYDHFSAKTFTGLIYV